MSHYQCPMHPDVKSHKPVMCKTCGMKLLEVKETHLERSTNHRLHSHEVSRHAPLLRTPPLFWGLAAMLALLVVYFGILSIANSPAHALQQFQQMWYWVVLLAIGFGIQVTLYASLKRAVARKAAAAQAASATSTVAASGSLSTASMVACCAHHLTDVLPLLGLTAVGLFLIRLQTLFIIAGLLSSLVGIAVMLSLMQRHRLYEDGTGILSWLMRWDQKKVLYGTAALSTLIFIVTLVISVRGGLKP